MEELDRRKVEYEKAGESISSKSENVLLGALEDHDHGRPALRCRSGKVSQPFLLLSPFSSLPSVLLSVCGADYQSACAPKAHFCTNADCRPRLGLDSPSHIRLRLKSKLHSRSEN